MYYFVKRDDTGKVQSIVSYDGERPNISDSLMTEITQEEYEAIDSEIDEKNILTEKLYTGAIIINDIPSEWREEIRERMNEMIEQMGTYDSQDISDVEALDIILGVSE